MVKILFLGDILPANSPYFIGNGIASEFIKHQGNPWIQQLKEYTNKATFTIGNLESPLINDKNIDIKTFCGPLNFAEFLSKIQVSGVSVANNHILEYGIKGFNTTINSLVTHGIKPIGIANAYSSNIHIFNENDINIGVAAFNDIHDFYNNNLYAELNFNNVKNTLSKMDGMKVNYKIIILHWGNEYNHTPNYHQRMFANKIVDAGADVIIGHHPHVIQSIEKYKHGIIFYSLGNFMFDMFWSKKVRLGMGALISFHRNKIDFEILPAYRKDFSFIPSISNHAYLNKKLKKLSRVSKKTSSIKKEKRNVKKNRLIERIRMKLFVLKNWFRLTKHSQKYFIKKLV